MPTKIEKDAITGQETTGHEWDGVKELNTPLPKWWLYVLYATIVYAAIWWVLYPSWPWFNTYFGGVLGYDQRTDLTERAARSDALSLRAEFLERIRDADLAEVARDPELMSVAFQAGEAAFADNCAPCHGLGGAGQGIYPSLADDAWIWGGTLAEIQHTVQFGIRSAHPDTRFNVMPAFGADRLLERGEIKDLAQHVLSLSGQEEDAAAAARGAEIYAAQCAACHGESGEGVRELGGPNLADAIWLYGDTERDIIQQIHLPRHGMMPAWADRLDPAVIKSLTLYVHALGGGQ
jgi:cytochrome c oxidase cbb3-type subunit 3